MPLLGVLHMMIAIGFAIHAMRTGRPQYWLFILIFVPLLGSIAYVVFELLPELASSRRAQKVTSDIGDIVDPDREWRRRREAVELSGSVKAKRELAEECERKGMWQDAIALYREAAQGIYKNDVTLLSGLARAELSSGDGRAAQDTLEQVRDAHPKLQDQEAHLLYARALEAQGLITEAQEEYEALRHYYVGFEARTRYGLMLLRKGEPDKARGLFEDVVKASGARRLVVTDADRDWLKVAKANL
jgi:hypothetical protein